MRHCATNNVSFLINSPKVETNFFFKKIPNQGNPVYHSGCVIPAISVTTGRV